MCECRECGDKFTHHQRLKLFCTSACRMAFNNRRRDYGSAMFDIVMEMRFDRKRASASKAWTELCVIASRVRDVDVRERGGRKSWSTTDRMRNINSRIGR
jgi:hypothetical protein